MQINIRELYDHTLGVHIVMYFISEIIYIPMFSKVAKTAFYNTFCK